jgi:hypothetical protein
VSSIVATEPERFRPMQEWVPSWLPAAVLAAAIVVASVVGPWLAGPHDVTEVPPHRTTPPLTTTTTTVQPRW